MRLKGEAQIVTDRRLSLSFGGEKAHQIEGDTLFLPHCLPPGSVLSRKFSNLPTVMWKLFLEWPEPFHTYHHCEHLSCYICPRTAVLVKQHGQGQTWITILCCNQGFEDTSKK